MKIKLFLSLVLVCSISAPAQMRLAKQPVKQTRQTTPKVETDAANRIRNNHLALPAARRRNGDGFRVAPPGGSGRVGEFVQILLRSGIQQLNAFDIR